MSKTDDTTDTKAPNAYFEWDTFDAVFRRKVWYDPETDTFREGEWVLMERKPRGGWGPTNDHCAETNDGEFFEEPRGAARRDAEYHIRTAHGVDVEDPDL